ncbi:hypothetical protein [Photobacterium damselae]|uniref:hypothetical protein n=1 Tax=Photobacterium damselae TaxID=38293 RepID=UPI000D661AAA|nr:hypothetical protein [Photobacterium damselae]AWK83845.1 hypothetical protein BST98_17725 [Photobacterium damselae]
MSLRNKKTEASVELLLVVSWALLIVAYIYCSQFIDFGDKILSNQSISEYQTESHVNSDIGLYIPSEYEGDE